MILALLSSLLLALAVGVGVLAIVPLWQGMIDLQLADRGTRLRMLGLNDAYFYTALFAWAIAMVAIGLLLTGPLNMWPIGLTLVVLMYHTPGWVIDAIIRRRERVLRDQLVPACFNLACGVKAGLSLPDALERAANDTPAPLGKELQEVVSLYCRGQSLRASIAHVRDRLGLELFSLVAAAMNVAMERGGNLAQALDKIASTVRENQRLEGKRDALTAGPRNSIITLAVFPVCFVGLFFLFDRNAVATFFSTFPGQITVSAGMMTIYIAIRWANSIMRAVI